MCGQSEVKSLPFSKLENDIQEKYSQEKAELLINSIKELLKQGDHDL